MANTLRFKRGLVSGIPTAALGEPLFTTDTFDLYIGNGTTNTRFQKYIASGTTSQLLRGDGSLLTMPIVLTSPSNGQVLKYNGTSWVNDSDAGITGSGASGQVAYFTGATTQSGSNNLFWDATNNILSVGSNVNLSTAFRSQFVTNGNSNFVTSAAFGNTATFRGAFYMLRGRGTQSSPSAILSGDELGQIQFAGYFGTLTDAYVTAASIRAIAASDFTTVTQIPTHLTFSTSQSGSSVSEKMRLTDTGRLLLGSTTDNGLRFQVTGDGYFSGSVGIGTSSLTGYGVRNSRTITGALACYGFSVDGTIQSDATSSINIFHSLPATQAAAFNIGSLIHFIANQGTQGAGSTISNQYGFLAQAGLTGATNNYGFYGNIASGTGRWNLYMNGTAANYLNGSLGISSTSLTGINLRISKTITGAATAYGVFQDGQLQTDVTANGYGFINSLNTIASTNVSNYFHFRAVEGNIGASTTVANHFGFYVNDMSAGTARYGYWANLSSASNKWNFYAGGSAANYFNGNTIIGGTATDAGFRLDVNGTMRVSGASTLTGAVSTTSTITSNTYVTAGTSASPVFSDTFNLGAPANLSKIQYGNEFSSTNGSYLRFIVNSASGTNTPVNALTLFPSGAATFSSSVTAGGLLTVNGGTAISTANFTNTGTDGGIDVRNTGTLALTRSSQIRLINGTTFFGANDRTYQIVNIGTSATSADYFIQYWDGTSYFDRFRIASTGAATFSSSVQAGGGTTNASAILQADSTTKGFLPPRMTTTQRNAITTPAAGLIVYDTTDNKHYGYNGTTWNAFY